VGHRLPQTGQGEHQIAHLLWGGLLMVVVIGVLLSFLVTVGAAGR